LLLAVLLLAVLLLAVLLLAVLLLAVLLLAVGRLTVLLLAVGRLARRGLRRRGAAVVGRLRLDRWEHRRVGLVGTEALTFRCGALHVLGRGGVVGRFLSGRRFGRSFIGGGLVGLVGGRLVRRWLVGPLLRLLGRRLGLLGRRLRS
jgi:hypothetical protein